MGGGALISPAAGCWPDPGSRIPDPGSRVLDPGSRIPDQPSTPIVRLNDNLEDRRWHLPPWF
jgi:hypothetical protein